MEDKRIKRQNIYKIIMLSYFDSNYYVHANNDDNV